MQRLFFVALAMLAGVTFAKTRPEMLVRTEWLAQHAKDPDIVILHVGTPKDYEEGHIPGARLVRLADISITGPNDLRLELPSDDALATALARLGITNKTRNIVYAATESIQSATRVWFTLDYAGLSKRSSLLDGGLATWKAEGRPVSTEAATPAASKADNLKLKTNPKLVIDSQALAAKTRNPKVMIVDARLPQFYSGAEAGIAKRPGHIPGARNVPFPSLLENGKFKNEADLRKAMPDGFGAKQVVSYCHIGQQATVVYFVARYLGEQPLLYDGSFQDWSSREQLPVETSSTAH